MQKKILTIIAHPDDESFGFGGTLALYARYGVELHVLCATRGESGEGAGDLKKIRSQELQKASEILGVTNVSFLNYGDGMLSNNLYHEIADKIKANIASIKPQVILTFDHGGVSGHLDHIFMSMVTTFVVKKYFKKIHLFYLSESKEIANIFSRYYYIYFPPGVGESEADIIIDISKVWQTKVAAMKAHKSQRHDAQRILLVKNFLPKREYFCAATPQKNPKSRIDFFDY